MGSEGISEDRTRGNGHSFIRPLGVTCGLFGAVAGSRSVIKLKTGIHVASTCPSNGQITGGSLLKTVEIVR